LVKMVMAPVSVVDATTIGLSTSMLRYGNVLASCRPVSYVMRRRLLTWYALMT
jgi:hypothetical protein